MKKWKKPKIKHLKPTKWNWMVSYPEKFELGKNVDIGAFTYINARFGVVIEDDVQIGSHCAIYSHDTENEGKIYSQSPVYIAPNSKIGSHCVILPGVSIWGEKIPAMSLIFMNRHTGYREVRRLVN